MRYALIFLAGMLCPVVAVLVVYLLWTTFGRNTGWPT